MEFQQGVSLLVGSYWIWKFIPETSQVQREETNPALVAVNASLGWTLQGPVSLQDSNRCKGSTLVCVLRTDTRDNENLSCSSRWFWEVDTVGLKISSNSHLDEAVLCKFKDSIGLLNVCHDVEVQCESMANDCKIALSRLHRVPRQLSSNEEGRTIRL